MRPGDRKELEGWIRARRAPQRRVERARIVRRTLQEKPPRGTHWSTRLMAECMGLHHSQVGWIWKVHGLKPHRVRYFKLSTDPRFVEKLRDVVGLYVAPPERAIVFSFDEKSQIQALDRTQPGLPLKKGRAGTMTHDYKRHGATTLFAALDVATGEVIHQCLPRHRHQEFLRFLRTVENQCNPELELHFILDNYATHKHARVKGWWTGTPACTSTSCPPRHPGSTSSSASSPNSPSASSSASPSTASASCTRDHGVAPL